MKRTVKKLNKLLQIQNDLGELQRNGFPIVPTVELPQVDMYYSDDGILNIMFYLPNFTKDEVELGIDDDVLIVRALEKNRDDTDRKYILHESSRAYSRQLILPEGADSKSMHAKYENNILEVSLSFKAHQFSFIPID